ncbi:MAG: hypothetical protein Q7J25_07975 [Vicinamibacterales bacterium]|nr:hypothetical protein [Vicinamibacterales bacterium]
MNPRLAAVTALTLTALARVIAQPARLGAAAKVNLEGMREA